MKSPFDNTPENAEQASSSLEELAVSLGDLAKNSKETRVEVNLSTRDLELMRRDLQRLNQQMDRQAASYWKNPQTHPAFAPGATSGNQQRSSIQVQAQAEQRRLTDAIHHLARLIESRGTGSSSTAQTAVTAFGLASVQAALHGQTSILQGLGQGQSTRQQPTPVQQPAGTAQAAVSQTLTPYLRQLDMARAGQMHREDLRGSLEELPGYRLKELRDHIGAEPGGRSNAEIVERILGTVPGSQREEPPQEATPAQQRTQQPTVPAQQPQPTAPPAQQTTPTPTATQASPPVESTAPTPTQPTAQTSQQPTPPPSVHAPFSLAAMRSQWQGNPPPTEEEIEKRMESMKMPELKALRDEMKGEEGGRSKEELRERIRAAHRKQQQEYQAFLASQAQPPPTATIEPTTTAGVEVPSRAATPTQTQTPQTPQTPQSQTAQPTMGTPATIAALQAAEAQLIAQLNAAAEQMERLGGDDLRRAAERLGAAAEQAKERLTAAATPPASPPGIPPGAPPGAPDPGPSGEEPERRRRRRERPRTPAAPDLGELERRLPGMNEDQLRRERDRLGLKGGRSNDELRSRIFQGARQMHRDEFTQTQNTAYDRARSQYMYQRLILPEVTGGPHQRVANMQAQLMGASSVYMAREQEVQQRATASYLATNEGANNLTQAAQAQAQGGQIGNLNTLKQQVELEQQKLKYMRTPEGRQALKEEARLQRELLYIQKQAPWEKMVAEQGKFGAGVTTAHQKLGELQRKLSGVGQAAGNIWALGTTGIMGLVAMADPFSTFPTLQESVKGLGIELGQGFLPIVDSVSQRLQNMTHWLEGFDSATKKNVASSAAWVIAGAGVVYAATKIGFAVYGAVGALRTFQLALVATPVSATLGGFAAITTAAVGLAAAYSLLGNNAREAGNGMATAADKAELKRREDERRSIYESLPSDFKAKYRDAKDEEGRREVLREHQKKAKEDLKKAKAAELKDKPASEREALEREIDREVGKRDLKSKGPGRYAAYLLPTTTKEKEAASILESLEEKKLIKPEQRDEIRKLIETKAQLALYGKEYRSLTTKHADYTTQQRQDKIAELEAKYHSATRLMERTGTQDGGLLRAYRNMPAPTITDPMSYADKIQIQALKGDDLTNQNLAKQLQALDKLGVLLTDVKGELRILNTAAQRPINPLHSWP